MEQIHMTFSLDGENTPIDAIEHNGSVWTSYKQIAILYNRSENTIEDHIRNILKTQRFDRTHSSMTFAVEVSDNKIYQVRHFSLDVIYAVGYRVHSNRGESFKAWSAHYLNRNHTQEAQS